MYTECPSCQTFFKITPNQLKAAGGKVRCGNCDEVFSALDGLVDVVPEDAVSQAAGSESEFDNTPKQESQAQEISEIDVADVVSDVADAGEPSAVADSPVSELFADSDLNVESLSEENSQPAVTADDTSMSFADVEVPGMAEDAVDDIELALESAMVSEPKTVAVETKSVTEQEEINKDIDAALDGLFDGNTEVAESAVASEALNAEPDGAISTISELDELQDLDFGSLGESEAKKPEASTEKSTTSDIEDLGGVIDPNADETSSLSEFERELNQISSPKIENEPKNKLDDSSFDLGDSFLDSEAVEDRGSDAGKKTSGKKDEKDSELYSGDSYILEELDEDKAKSSGTIAKVAWITIIVALLLVLLGQFAYLKRNDLAMYPEVKPVIEGLCGQLNQFYPCEITAARDVSAIELLERNVVSHPNAKNALLITSVIENNAKFDQPYPNLVLTFSDINQKIIARRKFKPDEYLSKEVDQEEGMKKGVPIKLMLEIVDPGEEAVNFEFNFQ